MKWKLCPHYPGLSLFPEACHQLKGAHLSDPRASPGFAFYEPRRAGENHLGKEERRLTAKKNYFSCLSRGKFIWFFNKMIWRPACRAMSNEHWLSWLRLWLEPGPASPLCGHRSTLKASFRQPECTSFYQKELCIDSWKKKEGCLKRKGRQLGQNEKLSVPIMSLSFHSSHLFIHSQHNNVSLL